jgi:hypothetical protein
MNYVKKSLIVAAVMMPLSFLAMDAEKNEKKPLFEPLVSNSKPGWQLGGEVVMEPHELEAAKKAQKEQAAECTIPPYFIHESDFDLTGTRWIEDDPRLMSSNPSVVFNARIKDFPQDIKEQAVLTYARKEIIAGMSLDDANRLADDYQATIGTEAYARMLGLLAKSACDQSQGGDESKK